MNNVDNIISKSHPDAITILAFRGLVCEDAEMEKNIGRQIKYINWTPSMGTLARDNTFTIIGVQKNYKGEKCYRVMCDGYNDTFGRVAKPDSFEFIN